MTARCAGCGATVRCAWSLTRPSVAALGPCPLCGARVLWAPRKHAASDDKAQLELPFEELDRPL